MPNVTELSSLKDIPILKAGTHHSRNAGALVITEDELDTIVKGSNECKPIVKEAMSTGSYPGIDKKFNFVPGALNILHNDILDETIKDRVKDVDWSFGKATIDGTPWLTVNYDNVPKDIAKAVKHKFPFRSAELIPLTGPSGTHYDKVVRSTAFLDRLTPPAVKGQSDDITVELSEGESPVIVLYSTEPTTTHTEGEEMADKEKQAMPETGKPEVDVSELTGKLSEKDKLIAELQAENTAKVAELEAARNEQAAKIAELEAAQDVSAVKELMDGLSQPRKSADGKLFEVSPAAMELMSPLIGSIDKGAIIELSGEQKHARPEIADAFGKLLDLAANDGLVACVSELAAAKHTEPAQKPTPVKDAVRELMDAEQIDHLTAWNRVNKERGTFDKEVV